MNLEKEIIALKNRNTKYIHEREIYIVDLDPTKGIEMNKMRPCLVVRVYNQKHLIILPLSSQHKKGKEIYKLKKLSFLEKESFVCCHQIRIIDRKRCKKLIGKIPDPIYLEIKKILGEFLRIPPQEPNGHKSKEKSLLDQKNDLITYSKKE